MVRTQRAGVNVLFTLLVLMVVVDYVKGDAKEREECTTQLIGLSTCLPYVGGTSKSPTPDCCSGLKQVLAKSKKCLCLLVRDRNDPTLGLKVNATLAMNLPSICKSDVSIADCPALLHLAPNSPEAQIYQQFEKSLHDKSPPDAVTTIIAPNPKGKPDTAGANQNMGMKILAQIYLMFLVSFLI